MRTGPPGLGPGGDCDRRAPGKPLPSDISILRRGRRAATLQRFFLAHEGDGNYGQDRQLLRERCPVAFYPSPEGFFFSLDGKAS